MRISDDEFELSEGERVEEMPLSDVPTDEEFDAIMDEVWGSRDKEPLPDRP